MLIPKVGDVVVLIERVISSKHEAGLASGATTKRFHSQIMEDERVIEVMRGFKDLQ